MNWYMKAAKNGNGVGLNNVGYLYRHGLGVRKYVHTAVKWYTRSANKGYSIAQYNLGLTFKHKHEVKDVEQTLNGIKWLPIIIIKMQRSNW
jgi:TPR repeat protein